jgi:hypothetical protein
MDDTSDTGRTVAGPAKPTNALTATALPISTNAQGRLTEAQSLITQHIFQAPIAFVGLIYAMGFVVMTNLHARTGLPTFDLLRVKYLTAGLYYLVISSGIIVTLVMLLELLPPAWALLHARPRVWMTWSIRSLGRRNLDPRNHAHRGYVDTCRLEDAFLQRLYGFMTVAALTIFPLGLVFLTRSARSRYVILGFLGLYIVGIGGLLALRFLPRNPRSRLCEGARWFIACSMWFFAIDVLIAIPRIPAALLHSVFYVIFTCLLGLQIMFFGRIRQLTRSMYQSERLFWLVVPCLMFIVAYLSLINFAWQMFPRIPWSRGGAEVECVDVEIAQTRFKLSPNDEVARQFEWLYGLILLDDRSDLIFLTRRVAQDGAAEGVVTYDRASVRELRRRPDALPTPPDFGTGWRRLFQLGAIAFLERAYSTATAVPDLGKQCTY